MIYVIDDKEEFLNQIKDSIDGEIATFSFSNDALVAASKDKPEIIICDVMMPSRMIDSFPQGLDGLTLCTILQAVLPHSSIIIISGNERSEVEEKYPGKLSNFKYFFNKPLSGKFFDTVEMLQKQKSTSVTITLTPDDISILNNVHGDTIEKKIAWLIHNIKSSPNSSTLT